MSLGVDMNTRSEKRAAFTLIELLVVIGIIGVLSAMILGLAGYASRKSARSKAIATMGHIQNCLEEYRVKKNEYPDISSKQLRSAVTSVVPEYMWVEADSAAKWEANANTNAWLDPWEQVFIYNRSSRFSYKLYSTGPNFKESSDDIVAQGSAQ